VIISRAADLEDARKIMDFAVQRRPDLHRADACWCAGGWLAIQALQARRPSCFPSLWKSGLMSIVNERHYARLNRIVQDALAAGVRCRDQPAGESFADQPAGQL
jgi:hypothetical protein